MDENQSIYDLGFDKSLNRPIEDNSTGVVYDSVDQQNTGSIVQGGNLTLKTLSVGGLTRQVAPGDDINAAIDAINREGGGTVQLLAKTYTLTSNINMKPEVALVGAGIDSTILEFTSQSLGVRMIGTSTSDIYTNMILRDFTIQNSNSTAGLDIQLADFFRVENLKITSCDQKGIRIQECRDFILVNCASSNNTGNGLEIIGTGTRSTSRYSLINCLSLSNSGIGYSIQPGTNTMFFANFISCRATSNTGDGFDFTGTGTSALDSALTACVSSANGGIGFDVDSNCQRISFTNCFSDTNSGDGFEIAATECSLVNCYGGDPVDLQGNVRYVGNSAGGGSSIDPSSMVITAEKDTISYANQNENTKTRRLYQVMKNTSGAGLRNGNVVVLQSVATGDEITTTTTNGDNKVFGITTGTNANNGWSVVLTEGYTTSLYAANGTSSISIGDWLSAYSHAYYAKKAVAGDMAFAMALETPTTGTAVIDALILPPRLI